MNDKEKCANYDICSIKTSNESHFLWKKHFYKNPSCFSIYADFEADNEIDNSNIGNKTTNIHKQNPVCNGYKIKSDTEDVLESDCHKSPLYYNSVGWFVHEIIKLENKMCF